MAVRVLSIDGGGIRGIIPATIVMALEQLTGRRAYELFDVFVGTSTGGILTLALTCPRADGTPRWAADIRSLYLVRGPAIFPLGGVPMVGLPRASRKEEIVGTRTPLPATATTLERFKRRLGYQNIAKAFAPFGGEGGQGNAKYPAGPLEEELRNELEEVMMSRALRPVAVVSCDLDRGLPLVFRGGGLPQGVLGDTQMRHAARATSAGPTFFPLPQYRDTQGITHQCADGGLIANDPAIVGFAQAQGLGAINRGGTLLVSLGTGTRPGSALTEAEDVAQLVGTAPWWNLMKPIFRTLTGGPGILARDLLATIPSVTYVRLQPTLDFGAVHAMDDVTSGNMTALRLTAEAFVANNRSVLERVASGLDA